MRRSSAARWNAFDRGGSFSASHREAWSASPKVTPCRANELNQSAMKASSPLSCRQNLRACSVQNLVKSWLSMRPLSLPAFEFGRYCGTHVDYLRLAVLRHESVLELEELLAAVTVWLLDLSLERGGVDSNP